MKILIFHLPIKQVLSVIILFILAINVIANETSSLSSSNTEERTNPQADTSISEAPVMHKITTKKDDGWWPLFQLVLWPDCPSYTSKKVYGVRVGPYYSGGTGAVYGAEFSPLLACSDDVEGVQFSTLLNDSRSVNGIRFSIVNLTSHQMTGFQMALANVNDRDTTGCEIGGLNVSSKKMRGFQLGVANYAQQPKFQIGAINIAKSYGIQIGGFNIIEDGWIPFFPGINFSF